MLGDLCKSPDGANTVGTSTTGSSEAAMLGGLAMLRRWESKREAEGKPYDKLNLVTGPVQFCWHKFTRYWNVEHREIPMEDSRLIITPEVALERCDENSNGVVPTLGVTEHKKFKPRITTKPSHKKDLKSEYFTSDTAVPSTCPRTV